MFFKSVLCLFTINFIIQFIQGQTIFRKDYTYIMESNAFYKFKTLPKTLNDAKTACEREGAMLFYPENETETLDVIDHWKTVQPFLHWIVVNMTKSDFYNNGTLKTGAYSNWSVGEPNNADGTEECIVLNSDGTLNDVNCNRRYPFICKKPNNTQIQWNKDCQTPYPDYKLNKNLLKCYKFHSTPRNWTDAYSICYGEQSYLAVINNKIEAAFLTNLMNTNLNKEQTFNAEMAERIHSGFFNRNGWITIKGVPLHMSEYNRWAQSQPDGGISEDCGAMSSDGLLHDISCSRKTVFICEHELKA